jgi:hypothetical protein
MPQASARLDDARAAIAALVERYAANRDRYQASTYNEETCRAEFITPNSKTSFSPVFRSWRWLSTTDSSGS